MGYSEHQESEAKEEGTGTILGGTCLQYIQGWVGGVCVVLLVDTELVGSGYKEFWDRKRMTCLHCTGSIA